jgi:hypothetical protein
VKGIPKLVIANEEVVAAWPSPALIPGIHIIIAFESVVIVLLQSDGRGS